MSSADHRSDFLIAMTREISERANTKLAVSKQVREGNARRATVGAKFRDEIVQKGIAAAGIDYDVILKRQSKENEALRREISKRSEEQRAIGERIRSRQDKWSKRILAGSSHVIRRRHPPLRPPIAEIPLIGEVLKPDSATMQLVGGEGYAQANPGNTVVTWYWSNIVGGDGTGGAGGAEAEAVITFSYIPGTDGLLGVFVPVTFNGEYSQIVNASCVHQGSTYFQCTTTVGVAQEVDGVSDGTYLAPSFGISYGQDGGPYCLGSYNSHIVDETNLFEIESPLVVLANLVVYIVVTVQFIFNSDNGGGTVDFSKNGRQITIPGVLLGLTPA
jgi:hypothetical protein